MLNQLTEPILNPIRRVMPSFSGLDLSPLVLFLLISSSSGSSSTTSIPTSSKGLGFHRAAPDGLILSLRVTPNAGRDAIEGAETRADGSQVLRLRVAAVPDKGKGQCCRPRASCKALGLPKSALSLLSARPAGPRPCW